MFEKLKELSHSTQRELVEFITENVVFRGENGEYHKRSGVSDELVNEAANALEALTGHYHECIKESKGLLKVWETQNEEREDVKNSILEYEKKSGTNCFTQSRFLRLVLGMET